MVQIQQARHCYQALFNTAIVWELIAFWFSPTIYCLEVSERPELNRMTSMYFSKNKHKMWPKIVNCVECHILQETTIPFPIAFLRIACYFLKWNTSSPKGRKAFLLKTSIYGKTGEQISWGYIKIKIKQHKRISFSLCFELFYWHPPLIWHHRPINAKLSHCVWNFEIYS